MAAKKSSRRSSARSPRIFTGPVARKSAKKSSARSPRIFTGPVARKSAKRSSAKSSRKPQRRSVNRSNDSLQDNFENLLVKLKRVKKFDIPTYQDVVEMSGVTVNATNSFMGVDDDGNHFICYAIANGEDVMVWVHNIDDDVIFYAKLKMWNKKIADKFVVNKVSDMSVGKKYTVFIDWDILHSISRLIAFT